MDTWHAILVCYLALQLPLGILLGKRLKGRQ